MLSGDPDWFKQSVSKNMDLVNLVNGGTYDERNISGRCTFLNSNVLVLNFASLHCAL